MEAILENALDCDIKELEFWEMTPGEVIRAIQSKNRVNKVEAQERATYDYLLASLIVKGVSITLGSKDKFPPIEEVYTGVFDELVEKRKAKIEQQKTNLSALRFKQFAQSYNSKFKNKEVPK